MKVEVHRTIKNIFKAKNLGDKIVVLANWRLTQREIVSILNENKDFIKNNVHKTANKSDEFPYQQNIETTKNTFDPNHQGQSSKHPFKNSSEHAPHYEKETICNMFCGKSVLLFGEVYHVKPTSATKTFIDKGSIFIHENSYSDKETRLKTLKQYLRRIAKISLPSQISDFGSTVSLCPEKIDFKEVAEGWLKCSDAAKKAITIDYRLIQLPLNLQHYVIVHAFTHLRYADHNTDFWHCLANFLPDYEKCIQQIKNYDFLKDI